VLASCGRLADLDLLMAADLKALSPLFHVGVVRLARCAVKDCSTKTRLALVVPCSDIEPNDEPGLAGIRLCGDHLAESIRRLSADSRVRKEVA
jgi:hypothetical protein